MAGAGCPDESIARAVEGPIGADKLVPHIRVDAAVARVRAARALAEARRLYTRTNFTGCISLLSISELELGRGLADPDPALRQRAHQLLSRVLLWLGICQWASGEPQAAAASFVRSAQLPSSPSPDPQLLPPELVAAYRAAVAAPRQQVSCQLDPPLAAEGLLVDGKGPTVEGNATSVDGGAGGGVITVPAGSHYLVLSATCGDTPECRRFRSGLGPLGMRSLRLEATPQRCRIQLPAVQPASQLTCVNIAESDDAGFVAGITKETGADRTLVVAQTGRRVALRLHQAGTTSFHHQVVSNLNEGETPGQLVSRSAPLLLGAEGGTVVEPPPPPPNGGGPGGPWYTKWWVWTAVGTAAAAIIAVTVVATASSDVRVVFGP